MERYTYFTPGPSELYPTVPQHIKEALAAGICSISHRSEAFRNIYAETSKAVREVFGAPAGFHVFFAGSATEWMERLIENCVTEKSLHFVNGAFSKRFFSIAEELGKRPVMIEAPFGKGFELDALQEDPSVGFVAVTHNETSSGVMVPNEDIAAIRKLYPQALIVVDVVSSAPYVAFDLSQIDAAFFSVQKGFGLPAGLGVALVNDRCIERARERAAEGISIGSYHNLLSFMKEEEKQQTPETPNVLGIYLLGRVTKEMLERGMDTVRAETERKAEMLYSFFGAHASLKPFVTEERVRSKTVLTVLTPMGSREVIEKAKTAGCVLGSGYKDHKETQIRIANFPTHDETKMQTVMNILKTI